MDRIELGLAALIEADPHREYNIVIVLERIVEADELKLDCAKILMNNVLSTTLTGSRIRELAKNENILSIEHDSEMGAFQGS